MKCEINQVPNAIFKMGQGLNKNLDMQFTSMFLLETLKLYISSWRKINLEQKVINIFTARKFILNFYSERAV